MIWSKFVLPFASIFTATMLVVPAYSASAISTEDDPGIKKVEVGTSPIGNYLAGRHAQARRDIEAAVSFLGTALQAMPEAPGLRQRIFILLVVEGRIKEALPLARALLQKDPKAPLANLTLAAAALRKGDHESVVGYFKNGVARGLNNFTRPMMETWSLAGKGKAEEALETLKKLDGNESTQGLFDAHRALLLDFLDDERAEEAYQELIDKDLAGSFRIVQHMGQYFERKGQADRARRAYSKMRADMPETTLLDVADARLRASKKPFKLLRSAKDGAAEALFSIGNSLRRQRAHETALILARLSLYLRPDFPIAMLLVADILEGDGRHAESNAIYAKIGKGSPFRSSADMSRANNFDTMGKTDEAIALCRAVASRRQQDPQPLTQLGNLLRRHKRWKEAIDAYTGAIERVGILEKRHWRLLYARGIAFERAGLWPNAEKDLLRALKFDPEQALVLNYVGYSWIDQGVHLERAQDMIRRAVALRPNDGYIIDSLGWGYYRLGKYNDAVTELERSIQIRPEDPVINDHLGDAYWRVGRKLEAAFQWNRTLSLKPDDDIAAKIRKKLKNGLGPAKTVKPAISRKNNPERNDAPTAPKKI